MSKWRIFVVAFWTFVVVMLGWQFYNYNNQVVTYSATHPEKHYFYDPGAAAPPPAPKAPAPDVRQTAYRVIPNTPSAGNFTVQFTVKNIGNVGATAIEVKVRPYRGITNGDEDNGHAHPSSDYLPQNSNTIPSSGANGGVGPISDNDPVSQFGQWVAIPDLAPGQSSSNSVVFLTESDKAPNENPTLEINFEPVKSK